MGTFAYKALDAKGAQANGTLEGDTKAAVAAATLFALFLPLLVGHGRQAAHKLGVRLEPVKTPVSLGRQRQLSRSL